MHYIIPDGFFFPRSRAEALTRLAVRTTEERERLRAMIVRGQDSHTLGCETNEERGCTC